MENALRLSHLCPPSTALSGIYFWNKIITLKQINIQETSIKGLRRTRERTCALLPGAQFTHKSALKLKSGAI